MAHMESLYIIDTDFIALIARCISVSLIRDFLILPLPLSSLRLTLLEQLLQPTIQRISLKKICQHRVARRPHEV